MTRSGRSRRGVMCNHHRHLDTFLQHLTSFAFTLRSQFDLTFINSPVCFPLHPSFSVSILSNKIKLHTMATAQPASPPPSYQSVTAATAFDEPAILATNSDSEDDGYIDVLNASSGERTSTAWVEGKTHRSLRQSVSEEIEAELKRQRLPSVQEGDVDPFNTPGDDDNLAWHDNDEFDNEDDDDDDENDGNDDNDSSDASTDAKPKEQDSTPADSKRRQYLKPDTSSDDQSMFVQVGAIHIWACLPVTIEWRCLHVCLLSLVDDPSFRCSSSSFLIW
eukprot:TRINITY_DN7485_c0_g1_i2.p1 TRINITY_DN7485_c0_g1~~TRINITY_DN7485_c0_g1_i2.p1  ORF type:complete len:277 (+),score=62.27 TRINITY_DN7485_c0_g1_i2:275-1105(+)